MEVNKAILEGMVLENAFNDIINEGSLIDWWIKTRASDRAYKDELKGHDIIDVHNAIVNIDDVIDAVQRLRKSSKTVHVDKDKLISFAQASASEIFFISPSSCSSKLRLMMTPISFPGFTPMSMSILPVR